MDIPNNQSINLSSVNKVSPPPQEPPKPLFTLTPFLKYFFLFLFVFLPFLGFYLGMKYQENKILQRDYSHQRTIPTKVPIQPNITIDNKSLITPTTIISPLNQVDIGDVLVLCSSHGYQPYQMDCDCQGEEIEPTKPDTHTTVEGTDTFCQGIIKSRTCYHEGTPGEKQFIDCNSIKKYLPNANF